VAVVPGVRFLSIQNQVSFDTGPDPVLGRTTGEFQVTQDYVAFPALLEFRVPRSRGFFVIIGPELGVLTSAELEGTSRFEDPSGVFSNVQTSKSDISDRIESINVTLNMGVGVRAPVDSHIAIVQIQYDLGLVNTSKESRWVTDWKTQTWELIVGFGW
jgi:hypothetical protein